MLDTVDKNHMKEVGGGGTLFLILLRIYYTTLVNDSLFPKPPF